ncbi:MAG: hypothetical protein LUD72_00750 [Bacteroidales bacterium]|nr:hypothetical protein [Bacteroidales bacterium]
MAKRRIHLTESQLYGLVEKALNETLYSQPSEGDNTDKQQLVNFIIQTMRDTFLTSVWDVEGYVELCEDGESEPRDVINSLQVINGSKLILYDGYVGNNWFPDEVDLFTLQKLAAYMNKEKQKAKSNDIVGDIEVSEIRGMILPYRFIDGTMIMPIACKYYTGDVQLVSTDDFYYNDYEDYANESLNRRVTESIIRKLRRM